MSQYAKIIQNRVKIEPNRNNNINIIVTSDARELAVGAWSTIVVLYGKGLHKHVL